MGGDDAPVDQTAKKGKQMYDISQPILTERRGPVLIITINRPEARNAFDRATSDAMNAAMDVLDEDDRLFIGIITGAGGNFSAGADLKEIAKLGLPPQPPRGGFGIMARPARKPLIAAVEGYAVAGGFETCLSCDLIVAARDARFGLPEVRHNLLASCALVQLPRRMPYHLAMELVLTGALREATWFERFGLVNRITENGNALAEALQLANELLECGPLALAASKETMFQSAGQDDTRWVDNTPIAQKVHGSEDQIEALKAFAEKRKPVWKGR
ncbi:crotonase/enoyl-CoA hydratase family protein [Bradyrhizobium brasilense]|uniref:Crotonase/enoyl-CoA hydratase family protein n=1 Tax=Bradyrhizobium brasilense TaxID=1419277 RepID=A0ABY8JFR8_9BRAD|nr:crotonase/enoyl-CoA hydratase family protein [Bradyrhizobium brasilense]WFU62637.1 crotonase/enoyl-CoA hydratase family protein [Bradyrhizobium brasilense]